MSKHFVVERNTLNVLEVVEANDPRVAEYWSFIDNGCDSVVGTPDEGYVDGKMFGYPGTVVYLD